MLYKTLQVGYCLWTATSEAAISFSWVPCTFPLEWLYSEWLGSSLKSLFKKNVGYFWPATFYPPPAKIYPRHATRTVSILTLFLASLSSLFLPRHQHLPDVAGQPGLIPTDTLSSSFVLGTDHRPTFLSSFVVTFKKRCLYSFIGICGTWMHRFAFWKFYLKPGLITSFRSALWSVRMDVRKHWSLSGLTFSMLVKSLRSFDLSRKIEEDSVLRVIDQILCSYLLSCMTFSVYEVARVTCLSMSVAKLVYLHFSLGVNKVSTR